MIFSDLELKVVLVQWLLKATLALLVALVLDWLLRRRFVLACATTWNATLLLLAALPIAALGLPPWLLPVAGIPVVTAEPNHAAPEANSQFIARIAPGLSPSASVAVDRPARSTEQNTVAALPPPQVQHVQIRELLWTTCLVVYALGCAVALVRLFGSMRAVTRLRRSSAPVLEATWRQSLARLSAKCALTDLVELRQSEDVSVPVLLGRQRPVIMLPCNLVTASDGIAREVILIHELAHVVRGDFAWQLLQRAVQVVLWFHPLMWLAERRVGFVRERACDAYTIHCLGGSSDYVATLLEMAGRLTRRGSLSLGLAVLRSTQLGERLAAMCNGTGSPRCQASRAARLATITVALLLAGWVGRTAVAEPPRPQQATNAVAQTESKKDSAVSAGASQPKQPGDNSKASAPGPAMKGGPASGSSMPAKKPGPTPTGLNATVRDDEDYVPSDRPQHYTAAGRLIGLNGRPVAGAVLIWETRVREKPEELDAPPTIAAQLTSDAQGRFSLHAELIEKHVLDAELLIRAKGYGLRNYTTILAKLNRPLEIQLEPSHAIEGSIFTPNGEPIKDAKVLLTSMHRYGSGKANGAMDETKEWSFYVTEESNSDPQRSYWPAPAVTDKNGQFRFDDVVPRSATAELTVLAKDFARTHLRVARPDAPHNPNENRTVREPKFTLVMENPWVVDGRIVDEKTGAGIPGAEIEVWPNNYGSAMSNADRVVAKSDPQGRYTLRVGSADMFMLKVHPPQGYPGVSTSLNASTLEKLAGKGRNVKYEIKLRPGLALRGRVVAADTGDPVAGATVVYRPERNRKLGKNSEFSSVKTAADGTFEVTGTDGKGFLLVDAPDKGFYRLKVDDKRAQRYNDATYPHGLLEVDMPAAGQREPFVIALHRGRELVVRVLDPAGKPVKVIQSAFLEQEMDRYFSAKEAHDGLFKINAAQPGRTYRVFLFSAEAMAGIVTELEAPADGRVIDVRLQPCGTIRGRYVYDGGAPVAEVMNFSTFRLDPKKDPAPDSKHLSLPFYENFARHEKSKRVTDSDGAFELRGIVPGVFMYLGLNYQFDDNRIYRAVGVLAPGEVKDMGDLVIHSQ